MRVLTAAFVGGSTLAAGQDVGEWVEVVAGADSALAQACRVSCRGR